MLDILMDSVLDSIKLIPFLWATYFIMEYLEHKTSDKHKEHMQKSGKWGPMIGGILGAFPQCGFSVSATNLYVGRVITLGTLIAVYLSTSDEMIPVFLSEAVPIFVILKIVGLKIGVSVVMGILIDLMFPKKTEEHEIHTMCEQAHCHCENGMLKSSVKHTVNITLFIFLITFILNGMIAILGEETIAHLILNRPVLGPVIAGMIGLIPNCASSVILAELYLGKMISAGTMLAGLLVGSGIGLLVLWKENKPRKDNIKIVSLLYGTGVLFGILFEAVGLVL